MGKKSSLVVSGVAGLSLVLSGTAAVAPAVAEGMVFSPHGATTDAATETSAAQGATPVKLDAVRGTFAFDQTTVDTNETIAKALGSASKVLCGASDFTTELEAPAGDEAWAVQVGGSVKESFTLSEADLAATDFKQHIMKCTCAGNPADGRAAVNAEVTGVSIAQILQRAQPEAGANTLVFTSSDGYEVELPLAYVAQRRSLIVYKINGEGLDTSVGGHNQLWLGSTSARYFARDIVKVELEKRDTPPPPPGSEAAKDVFPNSPNIAITGGE